MKRKIASILISSSLLMSISAVASAESVTVNATNLESPVTVINLGQTDIQSGLQSLISDEGNSTRATDGRNISYEFSKLTYAIFSASPLPLNTYGKVPLRLVQTSDTSTLASIDYTFTNKSGTKKSSTLRVAANLTNQNTTITFNDVPKGTASDPIFLLIENQTSGIPLRGNGSTQF